MDFHRTDDLLVTASDDESIQLYDTANALSVSDQRDQQSQVEVPTSDSVVAIAAHPLNDQLVAGTQRGKLLLLGQKKSSSSRNKNSSSSQEHDDSTRVLKDIPASHSSVWRSVWLGIVKTIHSKKYGVDQICFTHHPSSVVYSSKNAWDESLRYLSLYDNRYLRYFKGHRDRVLSLCMSPKNDCFMSGSLDHTVRLWDLRTNVCQVSCPLIVWLDQHLLFNEVCGGTPLSVS